MTKRAREQLTERFNTANYEAIQCATKAEFERTPAEAAAALDCADEWYRTMQSLLEQGAVDYHGVRPKTYNIIKRAREACGIH